MSDESDDARWRKAQAAEEGYWASAGTDAWRLLHELTEHYAQAAARLQEFLGASTGLEALEVGPGPLGVGFLAVYAAGRVSKITAVEPLQIQQVSPADKALEAYIRELQARVRIIRGRGEELPLPERSIDLACCINVLDHTQEPARVLAEIARVTRPGGVFVLGVHTRSVVGLAKWQVMRRIHRSDWFYQAHPFAWTWAQVGCMLGAGWSVLWCDRPGRRERLLGHQRMSTWILRRR